MNKVFISFKGILKYLNVYCLFNFNLYLIIIIFLLRLIFYFFINNREIDVMNF